ncbi:MAG: flagellin [Candidatus Marinimicrobia bacterium]|nr:flagellin [Candidatus Neomarinimicrobiota bacterium]
MGLRIQTNTAAAKAYAGLFKADNMLSKSLNRLSTGFRINSAADDAAGLAIANKLRATNVSLGAAARNVSEATSIVNIAQGSMNNISSILLRLKELSTQGASDNVSSSERTKINSEASALTSEVTRIVNDTKYQDTSLIKGTFGATFSDGGGTFVAGEGLTSVDVSGVVDASKTYVLSTADGAGAGTSDVTLGNGIITQTIEGVTTGTAQTFNFSALGVKITVDTAFDDPTELAGSFTVDAGSGGTFQVGADNDASADRYSFTIGDMTLSSLGISSLNLSTRSGSQDGITSIDSAIDNVNTSLGDIGAVINRLSFASANIAGTLENISAAESGIRDVDFAKEMTQFTKSQILQQAATAMLSQANAASQGILQLLG